MNWVTTIWQAISGTSDWMAWNLFLAVMPLMLSVWLFRRSSHRSPLWWSGVLAFIAFLPNAPYVLTDLIHLVDDIRANGSLLVNTLVVIPKYLVFVLVGFQAYVLSLINVGYYLRQHGLNSYILQMELLLHGLSAIGVYLGRFERLNSWYIVTRPHHVLQSVMENLLDGRPLIFMTIAFVVTALLYWLMKQVTLAVLLQKRYATVIQRRSRV